MADYNCGCDECSDCTKDTKGLPIKIAKREGIDLEGRKAMHTSGHLTPKNKGPQSNFD